MLKSSVTAIHPARLVLGSTSRYRKQLLERLGIDFTTASPSIDESAREGEKPEALVVRLAESKARAAGSSFPDSLIIGSDQVACIEGRMLGKPGTHKAAIAQLKKAAGKRVTFYTGLCLLNTATGAVQTVSEPFHVHFRPLTASQIENYLSKEQPYDCAGSFKSEGLGISLFERLEGDDPNALIGLPLIRLIDMLASEGISVP
ncbi:MAG: septum formation inhibitor Maf [Gammaproteobacteria bacterium]|nr:septum formation inhibitor Maf [Gammaproteobacteria bacterium]